MLGRRAALAQPGVVSITAPACSASTSFCDARRDGNPPDSAAATAVRASFSATMACWIVCGRLRISMSASSIWRECCDRNRVIACRAAVISRNALSSAAFAPCSATVPSSGNCWTAAR
ncbi:MAG: hypothetical protein L0I24_12875 [Pseudonocardia sp.]|nr:hypothetical protein [Pseudonocardia sp.]